MREAWFGLVLLLVGCDPMLPTRGGDGGDAGPFSGGDGGLGRIRLSVDPGDCQLGGVFLGQTPACVANTTPSPNQAYVAVYPN